MKISRKNTIVRRVSRLRREVKVHTQRMRADLLKSLEEIFTLAKPLAKGEFQTQTMDGVQVKVTLKERRAWARVAAYVAQIMNSVAEGYDERQKDKNGDELERTVPYHPHHGEACQQREYTPVDCHTHVFDHGGAWKSGRGWKNGS